MPILHQGYEPLAARPRESGARFLPIARAGIQRNLRRWVWALFAAALLFGSGFQYAVIFFTYAAAAVFGIGAQQDQTFMRIFSDSPRFYADLMTTQSLWALILGGVVGAGEIAEDLRTGALAFYLSRPVTRRDYVLGKVLVVAVPVLAVSVLPALVLFAWHATMVGDLDWVLDRWRVPLAIAGQGGLLCAFLSGIVLGVSSLARRRRWATVFIAGLYLGLVITGTILATPRQWSGDRDRREAERILRKRDSDAGREAARRVLDESTATLDSNRTMKGWMFLSPPRSIEACGRDFFGLPVPENFAGGRHWWFLLGLSALGFAVLARRVRAVEVVT